MKRDKYTITDVAKELGVSCSTISRAINRAPGVGEELRKKILAYVEEVGYMPSGVARGLTSGHLNSVALILGDIRNPFYSDLVFYIQRTLNQNGYTLTVFCSEYEEKNEIKYIGLTQKFNFCGLILLTAQTENVSKELQKLDIPVVMVNRVINSFTCDSVLLDNFKAGYLAATHLIGLGHRRIAFVKGPGNSASSMQRYEGFCQAMSNAGLTVEPANVFQGDLTMKTGMRMAQRYAHGFHNRPAAVILCNDLTAFGFMSYCESVGIEIPSMLSVVSFDDTIFSSLDSINLTTVSQHVELMSERAAELMLKRLRSENCQTEHIILDPELVVRGTAAAPDEEAHTRWQGAEETEEEVF